MSSYIGDDLGELDRDKATKNWGPQFGLGILSVVLGFVCWACGLHCPRKPPSPPSAEVRPHPNETSDASGAEVMPNPSETSHERSIPQIAELIAPDESELSANHILELGRRNDTSTFSGSDISDIDSDLDERIDRYDSDLRAIGLEMRAKTEQRSVIRSEIQKITDLPATTGRRIGEGTR